MKTIIILASVAVAISAVPALAAKPVNQGANNNGGGNNNNNNGGGNNNNGGGGGGGQQPTGPRACLLTDVSPTALACTGFIAGNLLNNSSITEQTAALNLLGFAWDGNFATVSKINSLGGGTVVDFSTADSNPIARLYGDTWVGLHFGGGGPTGIGAQGTGFFKINAGLTGLTSFLLNIATGSSGAVVYRTQAAPTGGGGVPNAGNVPEPTSWAMMIAGFGLVGATLRRRRTAVA